MAHYAIIDKHNNMVVDVITGVDETVTQTDLDGTLVGGSTEAWEAFYESQLKNVNLYVKRTSYNACGEQGNYRGYYAGIGDTFDKHLDLFIKKTPQLRYPPLPIEP